MTIYLLEIAKIFLFTALAVFIAKLGSVWINKLYNYKTDILSYPDKIVERSKFHYYFLPAALTLVFCRLLWPVDLAVFILQLAEAFLLLLIICTDIEQQVIFDQMIIGLIIFSIFSMIIQCPPIINRVIAAVSGGTLFFLLAVITRGGIGGGDIKLIFSLGLLLGKDKLIAVVIIGLILGGLAAFIMLITKNKKRKDAFAYGPYFALPAILIYILC